MILMDFNLAIASVKISKISKSTIFTVSNPSKMIPIASKVPTPGATDIDDAYIR